LTARSWLGSAALHALLLLGLSLLPTPQAPPPAPPRLRVLSLPPPPPRPVTGPEGGIGRPPLAGEAASLPRRAPLPRPEVPPIARSPRPQTPPTPRVEPPKRGTPERESVSDPAPRAGLPDEGGSPAPGAGEPGAGTGVGTKGAGGGEEPRREDQGGGEAEGPEIREVDAVRVLKRFEPEYPLQSRKLGEEGTTVLILTLEGGRVRSVAVERSSGHPRLDAAAEAALRRWRFESTPPLRVRVPVVFRLR